MCVSRGPLSSLMVDWNRSFPGGLLIIDFLLLLLLPIDSECPRVQCTLWGRICFIKTALRGTPVDYVIGRVVVVVVVRGGWSKSGWKELPPSLSLRLTTVGKEFFYQ